MPENTSPPTSDTASALTDWFATGVAGFLDPVSGTGVALIRKAMDGRAERRLEEWREAVHADLEQLDTEKIEWDDLKSEKFEDLAEAIYEEVTEERAQQKLDAYRALFLNTIAWDEADYDKAQSILQLVTGWSPHHIIMLRLIYDPEGFVEERGNNPISGLRSPKVIRALRMLLPEWDKWEIKRIWSDLRRDYIHDVSNNIEEMSVTREGIDYFSSHITGFGREVGQYLENPMGGS